MNKKLLYVLLILIIPTLSACGTASTPTVSPADMANTAIALAWTDVAMTQAALPTATATPIPPTPTLTFTPLPIPTLQPLVNAPTATSNVDPCNLPIRLPVNGTTTKIKLVNESKGNVHLSFGMTQKNDVGECGTYDFYMGASESPIVDVLTGCYWAYAVITGPHSSIAKSTDYICLTYSEKTRGVTITAESIGMN